MGVQYLYIFSSLLLIKHRKIERVFSFSNHFCSSLFISLFFIIWYQSSNLRALLATFIMAKIVDPSKDFSSPYHVSSQQHMICSFGTQQERQFFYNQSKANIDTNRSYKRQYTSKVYSHCGRTGHVIDTCYRKHGFPPQFKFKN